MCIGVFGTPEAVQYAASIVSDIVNDSFKGFAFLRQLPALFESSDAPDLLDKLSVSYKPGYGFMSDQVRPVSGCTAFWRQQRARFALCTEPALSRPCGSLRSSHAARSGASLLKWGRVVNRQRFASASLPVHMPLEPRRIMEPTPAACFQARVASVVLTLR